MVTFRGSENLNKEEVVKIIKEYNIDVIVSHMGNSYTNTVFRDAIECSGRV